MQVLYWNTWFITKPQPLFEHLMCLNEAFEGVDYFCLSEATEDLQSLFSASGWNTFYEANTKRRGLLIASLQPLLQSRSYLLSSARRFRGFNRNYLLTIQANWRRKPLTIALTHLSPFNPLTTIRRKRDRRKLARLLPDNYTLLVGDFNTVAVPYAKWDVMNRGYVSHVKGKTWCWHLKTTASRLPFKMQLDYVFSTPDISQSVSSKIMQQQKFSDHYPIITTLS